jgi:predicted GNAT superfamily acetyltransferase
VDDQETCSFGRADLFESGSLSQGLLALNNAHARELSRLEPERFVELVSEGFVTLRIGDVDAFLLAFDQDAGYDSPNFPWFRARHARFVYIDRVVVAPSTRGRGHARRLTMLCSDTHPTLGTSLLFARSTRIPPTRGPTPFMRHADSSKSAPR